MHKRALPPSPCIARPLTRRLVFCIGAGSFKVPWQPLSGNTKSVSGLAARNKCYHEGGEGTLLRGGVALSNQHQVLSPPRRAACGASWRKTITKKLQTGLRRTFQTQAARYARPGYARLASQRLAHTQACRRNITDHAVPNARAALDGECQATYGVKAKMLLLANIAIFAGTLVPFTGVCAVSSWRRS